MKRQWWWFGGGLVAIAAMAVLFAPTPTADPFPLPTLPECPFLNHAVDAAYVGAARCVECHAEAHESYQETGMAHSMAVVTADNAPADANYHHDLAEDVGGAGCLRRSRVVAEKRWPQEEKSAHNGQEARPRSLKGRESNERNPETGAAGKTNAKTSDALDTGGAHAVTIGDIPSLEWWFQVHPNGKSRLRAERD